MGSDDEKSGTDGHKTGSDDEKTETDDEKSGADDHKIEPDDEHDTIADIRMMSNGSLLRHAPSRQ